jgi:hypothetical protein
MAELRPVIPLPHPDVFVTVGEAFDDAGDAVGGRFGDDGRCIGFVNMAIA